MLKDSDAVWAENEYTPFGKWMDGWESRRRRTEGHDWCIVALGLPGSLSLLEVNTAFFTGNYSPKISISGAYFDSFAPG
jgi:allantoicase